MRIFSTIKGKEEAIIAARATKGRFIVATNDLDKARLPDEQILRDTAFRPPSPAPVAQSKESNPLLSPLIAVALAV